MKSYSIYAFCIYALIYFAPSCAKAQTTPEAQIQEKDSIVLVFAGDIMGHAPQHKAAYNATTDTYDFTPCYSYIEPFIKSADCAIGNLETPIGVKPYRGFPRFSSPYELAEAPLKAGFDILVMANNHVVDQGAEGIKRTTAFLNGKCIFAGAYTDKDQRKQIYPVYTTLKGIKFAFLNATYGTNGIPVPFPCVVNMLDTAQIAADVLTARNAGADVVIIFVHWGNEYVLKGNQYQRNLAQFFANKGIDLVIGAHPHVVEDFETVKTDTGKQVPVYYSLGNMISNQRKPNTNGGILAQVVIEVPSARIVQCDYLPFYVHRGTIDGLYQYYILPTSDYLSGKQQPSIGSQADRELREFDAGIRKRLDNLPVRY